MTSTKIRSIDEKSVNRRYYLLAPERLVSGNPQLSLWESFVDVTNNFSVGLWRGEVGTWNIAYKKDEYCEILEGKSVLTDNEGNRVTVTQGDRFVIPKGYTGTWEVVENTKKIYASYEPKNG